MPCLHLKLLSFKVSIVRFTRNQNQNQNPGHVGQLRFALRQDLDPASFGACDIEELRGSQPHGSDVLLLCKRFMSDPSPFRVICLVSAATCAQLRVSFQQPAGVSDRRAIAEKLRKNLLSKAPQCRRQGSITHDAEAYLIGWVSGTWPRIPRPARYAFLQLRRFGIQDIDQPAALDWAAPARFRKYTILRSDDDDENSEGGDDAAAPLDLLDS